MKQFKVFLLLLVVIPAFTSCNWLNKGKTVYHFLTMYPEVLYLEVGDVYDMTVNYSYYDSEDPDHTVTIEDFKCATSDEAVATIGIVEREVEYEGEMYPVKIFAVTAVGPGECAVTLSVDEQLAYTYVVVEAPESSGEDEGDDSGESGSDKGEE